MQVRRAGVGFAAVLGLVCVASAHAEFRFDEFKPRGFDYHDEYFISYLSFRPRLTHRWLWRDASVGYFTTVGSLRSTEFYIDQFARVRVPFSDGFTGEYRLVQTEDYDSRYLRNEVEVVLRWLRPPELMPLSETLGYTPRPDGLFLGASAMLEASKEFVDAGAILGYATAHSGVRFDAVLPDVTYNEKNDELAEYTEQPLTLRARLRTDLPNSGLRLRAWVMDDLPLRLVLPQREDLVFRYRKLTAGGAAFWEPREGLRFDLEVQGEETRKRFRYLTQAKPDADFRRRALRGIAQFELDVEPVFGARASRQDLLFGTLFLHHVDETTLRSDFVRERLRRDEAYGELGYLLALPTPFPSWEVGVRAATQMGVLSQRDVRPDIDKHTVGQKFLVKVGVGVEANSREERASFLVQATIRVDDPSFGGANAQVLLRF